MTEWLTHSVALCLVCTRSHSILSASDNLDSCWRFLLFREEAFYNFLSLPNWNVLRRPVQQMPFSNGSGSPSGLACFPACEEKEDPSHLWIFTPRTSSWCFPNSSQCCHKAPRPRNTHQLVSSHFTDEGVEANLARWLSGIEGRGSKGCGCPSPSGLSFFFVSAKARGQAKHPRSPLCSWLV